MNEQARARLSHLFGTHGFERALPGMELRLAQGGRAVVRLPVDDAVHNANNTLHGGAIATLVDIAGTAAIITADRDNRSGSTTDLTLSCLAPGLSGQAVLAEATVLKCGKTLAFVGVDVRREADGVLVAQGRMTKYMLAP